MHTWVAHPLSTWPTLPLQCGHECNNLSSQMCSSWAKKPNRASKRGVGGGDWAEGVRARREGGGKSAPAFQRGGAPTYRSPAQ